MVAIFIMYFYTHNDLYLKTIFNILISSLTNIKSVVKLQLCSMLQIIRTTILVEAYWDVNTRNQNKRNLNKFWYNHSYPAKLLLNIGWIDLSTLYAWFFFFNISCFSMRWIFFYLKIWIIIESPLEKVKWISLLY